MMAPDGVVSARRVASAGRAPTRRRIAGEDDGGGDYFLEVASADERSLRSTAFDVGFVVYASTAFGRLFVMKHLKLGTIGVLLVRFA